MTNYSDATRTALSDLSRIKAPTKRAAFIAETIVSLPTSQDVADFTRELRTRAGTQDVTMLPLTTWNVRRWENGNLVEPETFDPNEFAKVIRIAENIVIDWPSITFHYGVSVTFDLADGSYVAHSRDFRMTETYMSS